MGSLTRNKSTRTHNQSVKRSTSNNGPDHAQERRLTRISISIVWLFTFCNAWRAIPTIYEAWNSENGLDLNGHWPFVLVIIEHISHSLIVFNSAVNFLIYVIH